MSPSSSSSSSSSSASSSNPQSANPNPEREEEQTSTRRGRSFSRLSQQSQPRRICDTVQVGVASFSFFRRSSPHSQVPILPGKCCSEANSTIVSEGGWEVYPSITNLFCALADKCTVQTHSRSLGVIAISHDTIA